MCEHPQTLKRFSCPQARSIDSVSMAMDRALYAKALCERVQSIGSRNFQLR